MEATKGFKWRSDVALGYQWAPEHSGHCGEKKGETEAEEGAGCCRGPTLGMKSPDQDGSQRGEAGGLEASSSCSLDGLV